MLADGLTRWDASPLVVFAVLLAAGAVVSGTTDGTPHAVSLAVATALVVADLAWAVRLWRRTGSPDEEGTLSTLDGISLVEAPDVGGPSTPTTITSRTALAAALAWNGPDLVAVLVPRATRPFTRRYRVAVHLASRRRPYRVGVVPLAAEPRLVPLLERLDGTRSLVAVPARMEPAPRGPDVLVLALGGVEAAVEAATATPGAPGAAPRP